MYTWFDYAFDLGNVISPLLSQTVVFEARAERDVHIGLSAVINTEEGTSSYITSNTRSELTEDGTYSYTRQLTKEGTSSYSREFMLITPTAGMLSPNEFRKFWICWTRSSELHISVGRGGEKEPFMTRGFQNPLDINYVGFGTEDPNGKFRFNCTQNFTVCPELPTLNYTAPDCKCPYWPGKNCTYKCITGYHAADGDVIRTCGDDGQWTGTNQCHAQTTTATTTDVTTDATSTATTTDVTTDATTTTATTTDVTTDATTTATTTDATTTTSATTTDVTTDATTTTATTTAVTTDATTTTTTAATTDVTTDATSTTATTTDATTTTIATTTAVTTDATTTTTAATTGITTDATTTTVATTGITTDATTTTTAATTDITTDATTTAVTTTATTTSTISPKPSTTEPTNTDPPVSTMKPATTPQLSSASQLPTTGAPNDTSQAKVKKERKTVLEKIFEDPSVFKSKLASEDNATQEEWNGWKTGKNMPQGYDSNVSPQTEEKFDVTSAVKILHVGPLSEENANLSVTVEYSMGWVDARLRGLSTGWEPVPASFMWAPPLAFGTAVRRAADVSKKRKSGGRGGSHDDISMWLHPSGILFHRLTRTLYLSCVPSMARYPLDQQECSFKLHGYSGLYFPLHKPKNASSSGPVTTDMTAVVSQFELTGLNVQSSVQQTDNTEAACHLLTGKCAYSADHCTHMRGCSHGNQCAVCKTYFGSCQYESNDCNRSGLTQVSTLEVRLQFSRRLQSHVLVTFLPTTSVVMTSWLGFWLHPQEINGRVSLGISTLLSLIIKSSYGENPQTNLVRAYDVWMSGCLAMVMLALLETVLANFIFSGGKLPGCPGLWQTSVEPKPRRSTAWVGDEEDRVHSAEKRAVKLDFCAKILFPVAFGAFLIGFFTYYA
ncbi:uncharacterized protein LOC144907819 isoform X2 [Branchiostoma floridae x Branchiostoma belcheri]